MFYSVRAVPNLYNLRHAMKVAKVYNKITNKIKSTRTYGYMAVVLRTREMKVALDDGLFSDIEHKHWLISQQMKNKHKYILS